MVKLFLSGYSQLYFGGQDMKLTVLGKYGPYPAAGGACSGYLLETNDAKILIDCGNGVLSRLQSFVELEKLDAILVSHLHSDHVSDLYVVRYALDILSPKFSGEKLPFPLYVPDEPIEELAKIKYKNVFDMRTINSEKILKIKSLEISFSEMTHPFQSYSISVSSANKLFVYSGDTNYNAKISKVAKGADLFLADAGLLEKDKSENSSHMSAYEVGKVGKEAGVKRLLLTHIFPGYDENVLVNEAKEQYENVWVAQELSIYEF